MDAENRGEDRPEEALPPATSGADEPLGPAFSWFADPPPKDPFDLRCRIDDLKAKHRRGRLTVPTYAAGVIFFLVVGTVTAEGIVIPGLTMAVLCTLAVLGVGIFRRERRHRIEDMEALLARWEEEGRPVVDDEDEGPPTLDAPPSSGGRPPP